MTPYATSAFQQHSLLSTVTVIQGVVSAVIKPPMGKIADVFGRLESFAITIFLYTIGYIQQAASENVETFASAQIFWAAGFNGLQILQQIFVADTTDLSNRALFSTLFDVPFLWMVWAGPELATKILDSTTWRWGYGIWAIVLPVCFIPLAVSLWSSQRRAKRCGQALPSAFRGHTAFQILENLWFDLDVFGLLLLASALAPSADGKWSNASMIAMLVVGIAILIAFPFWETSKKLAPKAFFPPNLFRNRTVIAGTLIAFLYFIQNKSITTAGNITRIFSLSSTVSSIIVSLIIKYTGHYKYYVTVGSCIYLLGLGIMLRYRNEHASTPTLVGTQIAIGIGGGILNVPVQLGVQASASHQQVAAVTTVWLTLLEVGGAVGSAISGAIWSTYVPHKLQKYLPAETVANATIIFGDITTSSDYITYPSGSPTRTAINRAYQETMRLMLIAALFAAAPIVPLTFFLQNYQLLEMEQPIEGRVIGSDKGRGGSERGFWRRFFRR
ncbi:hypothetical protein SLS60_006501 [Paraconiothyrium brasiliense]|uniref:Major facilitator superfamily (MFS) profile domain-containing protein n=1 Tax=Paraconiothyrium brasiliense TaxID=300254 RepID=A0ABR3RAX8_9PLEO